MAGNVGIKDPRYTELNQRYLDAISNLTIPSADHNMVEKLRKLETSIRTSDAFSYDSKKSILDYAYGVAKDTLDDVTTELFLNGFSVIGRYLDKGLSNKTAEDMASLVLGYARQGVKEGLEGKELLDETERRNTIKVWGRAVIGGYVNQISNKLAELTATGSLGGKSAMEIIESVRSAAAIDEAAIRAATGGMLKK